jgi:hypothetical protein
MEVSQARQDSSYAPPSAAIPNARTDGQPRALTTFAVRAIALYFVAYLLSGQVGDRALPGFLGVIGKLGAPLEWVDDHIGPWLGAHVFRMTDLSGGGLGSGDGPREWIRTLWYAGAALVIAGVWTAARPRLRSPARATEWLRVFLRYPLAFTMVDYGVAKFARVQFGVLPLHQQVTPLGEFSPSALMWAFMFSSYSYRVFAGVAEVVGGALLLWRRTTTLGALIVFAVMSNVLAMNVSYDVSVKLLAAHLVLMSAILLAPELSRLASIFVLNRPTQATPMPALVPDPQRARWLAPIGILYATYAVGTVVWTNVSLGALAHSGRPAPLAGIYDVESVARNGLPIASASDPGRWNRVAIEPTGFMTILRSDDRNESYLTAADSNGQRLVVMQTSGSGDPRFDYRNYYIPFTKTLIDNAHPMDSGRFVLAVEPLDAARIRLSGRLRADSIDVVLRRFDESRLLLTHWGSHLVNRLGFSDTWIVAPYSGWPMDSSSRAR